MSRSGPYGRPDSPYKRVYRDTGRVRWVARYTDPRTGERKIARPDWNRRKGAFDLKGDAQRAIVEAIQEALKPQAPTDTLGVYADTWIERHPRSARTNANNASKLRKLRPIEVEGRPLEDWPLTELRRRQARVVEDHLLRVDGRALSGARNMLRVLSAMLEDAIEDELAIANPFRGMKLRSHDPRIQKPARKHALLSLEEMHEFARMAGPYEAMVRILSDCGLRLGQMLALKRGDWEPGYLNVHRTTWEGQVTEGDTDTKKHERQVPIPPSTEAILKAQVPRIDTPWLFPTLRGHCWRAGNFYRAVWNPVREATGMDVTPHDFRHSYVSIMRAAGVDPADLAAVAGHSVETMHSVYTHSLGRSDERIRDVVG